MSTASAEVTQALRRVLDPCSIAMGRPLDIVEMGLVDGVEVERGRADITLVLTDSACAFFQQMRQHVTDVVLDVPGVEEVDVRISHTTLWSPARMSEDASRPLLPLHVADRP